MDKNNKIPESEHQKIIDLFLDGMSQKDIGKIYGKSNDVIRSILRKHNIYAKDRKPKFSETDIKDMIKIYLSGAPMRVLEEKYNTSDTTIMGLFDKKGIQRRHSKYTCDDHYFDKIDTQEKAYFLGLLYADGYNNTGSSTISLTLQARDVDILNSFAKETRNTHPLRFVPNSQINPKWSDCYQFIITSQHMSKVLEKHGVFRAKSLILEFPKWLDESLYSHFIRGYFDGDGNICKNKARHTMSIVSTESFCKCFQDWIEKKLNIETHLYISSTIDKPTRTFMTTKKESTKILFDFIYNDAHLYLKRKHDVYIEKYVNVA